MSTPPLSEILSIDPEVQRVLGMTLEEIADMTTGAFAQLSYERGIEWTIHPDGGRVKGLTIRFVQDAASLTTG